MEDNFTRLMENFTYDPMEISWCLGIGWGMHEPLQLNETLKLFVVPAYISLLSIDYSQHFQLRTKTTLWVEQTYYTD